MNHPIDIAQQLLAIEQLVGADWYLPRNRNPLSEPTPAPGARAAGAAAAMAAAPQRRPLAPPPPPEPVEIPAELSPEGKASALAALNNDEVSSCAKCVLCQTRTQTVFGEGDPNADLVFVGEAPGADEDEQGKPFVGKGGQLLTKMITAMGLSREEVFIVNTLKCRPPGNRDPKRDELEACWSILTRQLQIIRPKVIVTLGNPSTRSLLQTQAGITKLRGTWQTLPDHAPGLGGTKVMPTFHPSFVTRCYTAEVRGQAWSDLQMVMEELGLKTPTPKKE
ncbi:MAG: uracil-DNA glycosylase [Phycisphaerales bacterium]|jgi:uracil-DNA glycosylase|nr:uracil-DNA glycosylase [Phycisphaerales bacterium]MBT7171834.1 uracil-DNA glycosylase [Phycisphaerales bacterium]